MNEKEINKFIIETSKELFPLIKKICSSISEPERTEVANDALQEAWAIIWKREGYHKLIHDNKSAAKGLAFTIAKNATLKYLEKRKKGGNNSLDGVSLPDLAEAEEYAIFFAEDIEEIFKKMTDRYVFILEAVMYAKKDKQEYIVAEIQNEYGIRFGPPALTLDNFRTILKRARVQFLQILNKKR